MLSEALKAELALCSLRHAVIQAALRLIDSANTPQEIDDIQLCLQNCNVPDKLELILATIEKLRIIAAVHNLPFDL